MSEIMLCGRPGKCCPTVEKIEEDLFVIRDDYDGMVKLTNEQIELLYAKKQGL